MSKEFDTELYRFGAAQSDRKKIIELLGDLRKINLSIRNDMRILTFLVGSAVLIHYF